LPSRCVDVVGDGGKIEKHVGRVWTVLTNSEQYELFKNSQTVQQYQQNFDNFRVVVMTWRGVRLVFLVRKMKQGVWHPPPPTSTSNATTTTAESSNIRREQTISTTKEFEKDGFFACLASSMLVPGAAGPPIPLLRSIHRNHHSPSSPSEEEEKEEEINEENISTCFDAFCYKPIPYRSAVANGATHVLALHSRPDGCEIPTKPTLYEKIVAPVYFRLNGLPLVGEYFENGGQQYRYLEDVLTLEDGLVQGCMFGPHATITTDMEDRSRREDGSVPVPPTEILFGTPDCITKRADPRTWKRVHLLPIVLPYGSDDGVGVGEDGNVNGGGGLNGDVGNGGSSMQSALERPVRVKGDIIEDYYQNEEYSSQSNQEEKRFKFVSWIRRKRLRRRRDKAREAAGKDLIHTAAVDFEKASSELELYVEDQDIDWLEAEALLAALPGFQ